MYYDEQIINGVIHYKNTPEDKFRPMSQEMFTAYILDLNDRILDLERQIDALESSAQEHICGE